jgi:hypothetical protein
MSLGNFSLKNEFDISIAFGCDAVRFSAKSLRHEHRMSEYYDLICGKK